MSKTLHDDKPFEFLCLGQVTVPGAPVCSDCSPLCACMHACMHEQ